MHPKKNDPIKVYVCFDSDNDFHYFRMMQTWHLNNNIDYIFLHGQDLHSPRFENSDEEIKDKIKKKIQSADAFVILIGESTRYLRKFVYWEMEQALELEKPIIGVNLSGLRSIDVQRCPPIIEKQLAVHISFNSLILQKALETWPKNHASLRRNGKSGPYYYDTSFYTKLGL